MFKGSKTTLVEDPQVSPYRLYEDIPGVAGWRQLKDPVYGLRHWTHVGMRLTTWSLAEVVRYGGLEEMLLLGEWGLFMHVPEESSIYEDVEWTTDYFDTSSLEGEPRGQLQRGALVASMGLARPGILEILMPDEDQCVRQCFTAYRFPNELGKRLLQKLPARDQNEDAEAVYNVGVGEFHVLGMPWLPGDSGEYLTVNAQRDPRSSILGALQRGTVVSLSIIVGTRAQLSRINGETDSDLLGGWVFIFTLDAAPTMERILYETEHMREVAENKKYHEELEAELARGGDEKLTFPWDPKPPPPPWIEPIIISYAAKEEPPGRHQRHPPADATQRETLTGGWRMIIDPVWKKVMFIEPISGRATWGVAEVIRTGGLEDLLLSRTWHICVVDPLLVELMKEKSWTCPIYKDKGMTDTPIMQLTKGTFVIVKVFDSHVYVATLLLPPMEKGGAPISGYAKYRRNDGRPIFRSLLPYPEDAEAVSNDGDDILAQPPEQDVLEGPFFVAPEPDQADIKVTDGQDIHSTFWTKLPRNYRLCTPDGIGFEEVIGTRARLPDLEGGGWVSLFTKDGTPLFRKEPCKPPTEKDVQKFGPKSSGLPIHIPVVWPDYGAVGMPRLGDPGMPAVPEVPQYEIALPNILERLGGGRALCDWHRFSLEGAVEASAGWNIWKSPLTQAKTTLDELLRLRVWKAIVAELDLPLREQPQAQSKHVTIRQRGSLLVGEWVNPSNAVRILVPAVRDDMRPKHLWTDLGTAEGSAIVPLIPGREFWIEPKGGHLSEDEQLEDNYGDPREVVVRATRDRTSERVVGLRRADAIQIAELDGRSARVIITYRLGIKEFPPGGWIDMFDESGWCPLKVRVPGVMHFLQIQAEGLAFCEPVSMIGEAKGQPERIAPPLEVPTLLLQIGDLEESSNLARDWHEQVDPVWGRLYYVNKWSGQVIHSLKAGGVYAMSVKLTLWFTNLTLSKLERDPIEPGSDITEGEAWALKLASVESQLKEPFAAMVDVPLDMLTVKIVDAPNDAPRGDGEDDIEDSIKSRETLEAEADKLPRFRIVATIHSPGEHASWAAEMLKQDMANADKFNTIALSVIGAIPELQRLKVDSANTVQLAQANLEEIDVPPWIRPPTPPPPPDPAPKIDDDFKELRKNLRYARPKILDYKTINPAIKTPDPGRHFAIGNCTAIVDGLDLAALEHKPFIEEVHFWDKGLVDYHMECLVQAFINGCMAQLTTLLLDDNNIGAVGAQHLGEGLKHCELLRELSIAQNPIGVGLVPLAKGLRSSLVVLNATKAELTDVGAVAAGQAMLGWPKMGTLRMRGNQGIGVHGADVLVRGVLATPSVKLADLQDTGAKPWQNRFARLLADAGSDPNRVRV